VSFLKSRRTPRFTPKLPSFIALGCGATELFANV
jgi:hypothetical protein